MLLLLWVARGQLMPPVAVAAAVSTSLVLDRAAAAVVVRPQCACRRVGHPVLHVPGCGCTRGTAQAVQQRRLLLLVLVLLLLRWRQRQLLLLLSQAGASVAGVNCAGRARGFCDPG